MKPIVGIVMGSDSDLPVMKEASRVLADFGVASETQILSAHRTPDLASDFAKKAAQKGFKIIIAGAGMANHLAGAMAANTTLPVIGVPLEGSSLQGLDALLSTVQMPPGVPVATVAVGPAGAKNAAYLAIEILALSDEGLKNQLAAHRKKLTETVVAKNRDLAKKS